MPRKIYTQEFRDAAVRLAAQPDATLRAIADALGITTWSLRRWIKEAAKSPKVRQDE